MSLPDPLAEQILRDLTDHALGQCLTVIKRAHDLIPEELETSFITSIATSLVASLVAAVPPPERMAHLSPERRAAGFAGFIYANLLEEADRAEAAAASSAKPSRPNPKKR